MKHIYFKVFIGIALLVLLTSLCLFIGTRKQDLKEKDLAKTLQVDLSSHKEYTGDFPSHYFYLTLKPGMTIGEVHQHVIGYQKVLQCSNRSEIYYYYTQEDDTARRFEILYDEEKRFKTLRGEENDSRTIQTFGCVEGTLKP